MAEFLTIELRSANLFINLALAPCSLENRARYVQNARHAFDSVSEFALRAALNLREVARVAKGLDSIRLRLGRLGESDWGQASVINSLPTAANAGKFPNKLPRDACKHGHLSVKALGRGVKRFEMRCHQLRADCRQMRAQNQALMKMKSAPHA